MCTAKASARCSGLSARATSACVRSTASVTTEVKIAAGLSFELALLVAAELKPANSIATSLSVCIACASRRRALVGGDCLFTPLILLTRPHIAVHPTRLRVQSEGDGYEG